MFVPFKQDGWGRSIRRPHSIVFFVARLINVTKLEEIRLLTFACIGRKSSAICLLCFNWHSTTASHLSSFKCKWMNGIWQHSASVKWNLTRVGLETTYFPYPWDYSSEWPIETINVLIFFANDWLFIIFFLKRNSNFNW